MKSILSFVACWKQTLYESLITITLLYEIIIKAKSDLEIMSEAQGRFKEHLCQPFEIERSILSHHFRKSQKHSNESQNSVLLKFKLGLDNDAQTNERICVASNGGFVCRSNPALSPRTQTAGQGFVDRNLPFTHRFTTATTKRTHTALSWLLPVQTKPQCFLLMCVRARALVASRTMDTPSF